uniref:Uncharacterized protein n=1 Tax=Anguilla anguilla TaxID=7936 RepID=A0A0E9U0N3_ANGAN
MGQCLPGFIVESQKAFLGSDFNAWCGVSRNTSATDIWTFCLFSLE